ITLHLVSWVKAVPFHQARGKTQRHRSVIRPCPDRKLERSSACHISDAGKSAARAEFDSRSNCVTTSETKKAPAKALSLIHHTRTPLTTEYLNRERLHFLARGWRALAGFVRALAGDGRALARPPSPLPSSTWPGQRGSREIAGRMLLALL